MSCTRSSEGLLLRHHHWWKGSGSVPRPAPELSRGQEHAAGY